MAQEAPEFSDGNMAFRKALNRVVDYAKRHGVNPAGVPGWSETADGWMPPRSRGGGGEVDLPWDIETDPESEDDPKKKRLIRPYVYSRSQPLPETLEVSGNSFDIVAGEWLVARIASISEPSIEIAAIPDGEMENVYTFAEDPPVFHRADIPLWRFYDEGGDGRVKLGEDLWGEKMVSPGPLRLVLPLYRVPSTVYARTVPDLI
jgi:hypothetical protein